MKKKVLFLISVILTVSGVSAQNMFFLTKEGVTLEYANLNNKGNADSFTRMTIQNVEGSGNNLIVNYISTVLNKNHKPVGSIDVPYKVTIVNGVVEMDMTSYAPAGSEGVIEIEGDKFRIPSNLSPGDKLDDVHFTVTINMVIKIRTEISLSEQECLSIEDITVPAGTFKCHKLTQTNTTTAMRRTMVTKSISWYADGIGMIKSETYDAKDKLTSSTVLQSME